MRLLYAPFNLFLLVFSVHVNHLNKLLKHTKRNSVIPQRAQKFHHYLNNTVVYSLMHKPILHLDVFTWTS